jgi:type IV pilus assembly protein PilX
MIANQFKLNSQSRHKVCPSQQKGFVLFLALMALVVLSLAAVALIRSVDTNNLIAGNLAFKQAATTSADAGVEAAIVSLVAMRDDAANAGKSVISDTTHTFNITDTATRPGYHSNINPALVLTANATWDDVNNVLVGTDSSGNTVQYIVQRLCRTANVAIKDADCSLSAAKEDNNGIEIKLPENICDGPGCPSAGQTPLARVTVRVSGPKNSVSYVQAFVY